MVRNYKTSMCKIAKNTVEKTVRKVKYEAYDKLCNWELRMGRKISVSLPRSRKGKLEIQSM